MALDYVLTVGLIGIPVSLFLLKVAQALTYLYEISSAGWMMPL